MHCFFCYRNEIADVTVINVLNRIVSTHSAKVKHRPSHKPLLKYSSRIELKLRRHVIFSVFSFQFSFN